MTQHFFIGIDGGASKSLVRVEDEAGQLLLQVKSGPANIRLSVAAAWNAIDQACEQIYQTLGVRPSQEHLFHAGMGLAGCEVKEAYHTFLNHPHPFATLVLSSDSHTACLGAHGGHDGAIIIAGTGAVGFQIQGQHSVKVGGWGFPHDDEGSGAWLGLEAIRVTLRWRDGRMPPSELARAVDNHFANDVDQLMNWADQANSTAFAELAPYVIETAKAGDRHAMTIMQQATKAIGSIRSALKAAELPGSVPLACALIGGIAPFLEPYLREASDYPMTIAPVLSDVGAIFLVKKKYCHHTQSA